MAGGRGRHLPPFDIEKALRGLMPNLPSAQIRRMNKAAPRGGLFCFRRQDLDMTCVPPENDEWISSVIIVDKTSEQVPKAHY